MYLQRLLVCLVLMTGISNYSNGQGGNQQAGKITGRVVNANKKPVSYATVTLLRKDATVVGGDLTADNGSFTIEPTGYGEFSVRISGIGMESRTIKGVNITRDKPVKNLGNVAITVTAQALEEVKITGERPLMQMEVDKKVFNVEKNITTAGGSASDVLQNVPSVSVDVDGNVSLRGKSNVTILIDGKPATLLGGDAAQALQSLSAASVQSVEVITNPSAKYDAQGMTGILNIITKRDRKFGFNGSVSAGAGTRDKYNGSLNLNLKNDKWNVFLNSSYRQNRNYHRVTTDRVNNFTSATSRSYEDNLRKFNGWFNSFGAEYIINEKNSVTLTQNLNLMQWGGNGITTYDIYSSPEAKDSTTTRSSYRVGGPLSSSTSLDYKHKFRKDKQELTGNATFAKSWSTFQNDYETNRYYGDGTLRSAPVIQVGPGIGGNSSINAQADFTTPFLPKNGKLETGLKSQMFWFQSSNTPTIDTGSGPTTDYTLLNNYDYQQQTHAAYASFSNQSGNWSYQGGLRTELALYEGTANATTPIKYTNSFLNLFPSAYVSYKLPNEQSVYLNYSRRTDRPHFMQLLPYINLSNPQDTSSGNPNLVPEFIHNVEFSYNKQYKKGHNFIVSTYYQYTKNLIQRYTYFYVGGTSFTQPKNLNSGVTYGLELTGRAQLLPIWDVTLNTNFFQNEVMGTNIDPALDNSGFSWFGKLNTNIKLPEGFSVQINGNYQSPKVAGQGRLEEVYWVDVALRKNLFDSRANLVLNISDIFNGRKYTTIYEYSQSIQTMYRDRETRIGNISFTYRFGTSESGKSYSRRRRTQQKSSGGDKERGENLKSDDDGSDGGF